MLHFIKCVARTAWLRPPGRGRGDLGKHTFCTTSARFSSPLFFIISVMINHLWCLCQTGMNVAEVTRQLLRSNDENNEGSDQTRWMSNEMCVWADMYYSCCRGTSDLGIHCPHSPLLGTAWWNSWAGSHGTKQEARGKPQAIVFYPALITQIIIKAPSMTSNILVYSCCLDDWCWVKCPDCLVSLVSVISLEFRNSDMCCSGNVLEIKHGGCCEAAPVLYNHFSLTFIKFMMWVNQVCPIYF